MNACLPLPLLAAPASPGRVSGPVERIGSFVRNGHSVFVVQFWQQPEMHVLDPLSLVGPGMAGAREHTFAMLALLQPGERLELVYEALEGELRCTSVRRLEATGGTSA